MAAWAPRHPGAVPPYTRPVTSSGEGPHANGRGGATDVAPGILADSTAPGLVDQLELVWRSLGDLCDTLGEADWHRPTECPGWSVADQVAHVVGTESMLAGRPSPEPADGHPPAHVHNDIGRFNEAWIERYRAEDTGRLCADFRDVTGERLRRLRAMTEAELDEPSWTPVGKATYRRFMQVRVFDCWVHEQDVRLALGRPGHLDGPAAEQALDEVVRSLGYVVGKRAGAPDGSLVRLELTGPVARTLDVAVDGRAAVVAPGRAAPTTTVAMGSDCLLRLACGRRSPVEALRVGDVTVSGDEALGRQVAEHLAFTI